MPWINKRHKVKISKSELNFQRSDKLITSRVIIIAVNKRINFNWTQ